jgi:hypothetical protein
LKDLPETGQNSDYKNKAYEPIEPGVGQKHGRYLRVGYVGSEADQTQNNDHRHDLTIWLRKVSLCLAIRLVHDGPGPVGIFVHGDFRQSLRRCQPQ